MKTIVIIAIFVGIGAIVAIIGGNYSVQTNVMNDTMPWVGLDCDEMIDFSGSDVHHSMHDSMHMEFHNYYFDHCSETESGQP